MADDGSVMANSLAVESVKNIIEQRNDPNACVCIGLPRGCNLVPTFSHLQALGLGGQHTSVTLQVGMLQVAHLFGYPGMSISRVYHLLVLL